MFRPASIHIWIFSLSGSPSPGIAIASPARMFIQKVFDLNIDFVILYMLLSRNVYIGFGSYIFDMKVFRIAMSAFLFLAGSSCIVVSQPGVTGAFVGVQSSGLFTPFGFVAVLASGVIFASGLESHARLTSSIKKDKSLARLANDAAESERAQKGLDHLSHELSKGNVPGRVRHLEGTDVFYVSNDEARLYYRLTKNGYEIVAKSRKGRNQELVLNKLEKLYKK